MNRSAPLVLVMLAALIAGAIAWLLRGDAGGGPLASPAAGAASADPAWADAEASGDLGRDADDRGALDAWRAEAGDDAAPLREPVDGAPRPGPLLLVVERGQPVAGARVQVVELREGVLADGRRNRLHDCELAERHGRAFDTSADGTVRLPPVRERVVVAVRRDASFGTRTIGRDHGEREAVAIGPDQTLRVRVVDAAGAPRAGVPVGVHQRIGRGFDRRLLLDSDEHGRVEVPHLQLHRRTPQDQGTAQFFADLHVPLAPPVRAMFRDDPVPAEPIELVLPPTGSVEVLVTGPDGAPFPNPAHVELGVARGDAARPSHELVGRRVTQPGADVPARFPLVGLGLELAVRVRLDDDDFTWVIAPLPGPARDGEHVALRAPLPDWIGLLCGRLVDPDGTPRVGARPTFLVTGRAGRIEGERLSTDGAGRFELPFRVREPEPPFWLEVRDAGEQGPIGALVPLSGLPTASSGRARTELGDIVLHGLSAFVAGRVVDDRGEPVARANVRVQRWRDLGGQPPRFDWRDEAFVETRSGDDGGFVLFAGALPGRVRVHARARDHLPAASQDLWPGAEVELVLARTGSLAGVLLVPPWLPEDALGVQLQRIDGSARAIDADVELRGRRARYRFRDLEPATYDLTVRVRVLPEPLLRCESVVVAPGDNELDPRLVGVDLSAMLFRYRLRAIDRDGSVLRDPGSPLLARLPRPGADPELVAFPWLGGRVEIFTTTPQLDVTLLGTGIRPLETFVAFGDTDLRVERLLPVEIVMPGVREACDPGRRVRVSAVLVAETGLPSSMRGVDQRSGDARGYSRAQLSKSGGEWLGDGDSVQIALMRDGRYEIVLRLYENGVAGPVSKEIGQVDVRLDGGTAQRLVVPIDRAVIDAVKAELQRRKSS